MKKNILFIIMLCFVGFTACEYDNYDEPNAMLSGRVIYQDNPVGIRSSENIQLELWQDGYDVRTMIPVFIAHNGSFSVSLFNGQYKLVRKAGAPWEAQLSDTIIVDVRGNTTLDVPVTPYFVITNENFQQSGGSVTANFTVNKIIEAAEAASVRLYIGKSILIDENSINTTVLHTADLNLSTLVSGQATSITAPIPQELINQGSMYLRIGVKSTFSNEYYYTQVQRVDL